MQWEASRNHISDSVQYKDINLLSKELHLFIEIKFCLLLHILLILFKFLYAS